MSLWSLCSYQSLCFVYKSTRLNYVSVCTYLACRCPVGHCSTSTTSYIILVGLLVHEEGGSYGDWYIRSSLAFPPRLVCANTWRWWWPGLCWATQLHCGLPFWWKCWSRPPNPEDVSQPTHTLCSLTNIQGCVPTHSVKGDTHVLIKMVLLER